MMTGNKKSIFKGGQRMLSIYLFFNGQCEEALNFYEAVFDSQRSQFLKFKDIPKDEPNQDFDQELVMHAELPIGQSVLRMCDNPYSDSVFGDNVVINYSSDDQQQVQKVWNQLIEKGSTVVMELDVTFFSALFGQCTDPYGVTWMVMDSSQ